jgi:hypothetical protein
MSVLFIFPNLPLEISQLIHVFRQAQERIDASHLFQLERLFQKKHAYYVWTRDWKHSKCHAKEKTCRCEKELELYYQNWFEYNRWDSNQRENAMVKTSENIT